MTRIALVACLLLAARAAAAQSGSPLNEAVGEAEIEPDRPDVTNGAHLVPPRVLQLEFGGLYTHVGDRAYLFGSPFTFRLGLSSWLEVRGGGDGMLVQSDAGTRETGFGNVQLGAKVGLVRDGNGAARISLLPSVNIPTASAGKGLGSGDPDYTIAILTGADLGPRGHADVNYGIGAIGAGDGELHFTQHTASISVSVSAARWSPYGELYWVSRVAPGGPAVAAIDAGAIYARSPRVAFDGGFLVGVSHAAPDYGFFAGMSIRLGHFGGSAPGTKFRRAAF